MSLDQFIADYEQENTSRWTSLRRGVGKALVGAALMGLAATGVKAQEPGQYAPFVDHDTTITAFNPTDKPMTVTASYGLIGIDPRNGAQVTVDIPPHATVAIPNALPSDPYHPEGSAYIQASGDDAPVLTASTEHTDGTGMNIPILPYDAKNNLQPQAGILANGMQWEKEILLSGDSTSNNTLDHQAYGPDGTGPTNAPQLYLPSGLVTSAKVGTIYQLGFPAGSIDTLIPQISDESKAGGLLLYTNPASGDTRLRPMQNFSTTQPTAEDYVNYYFPQGAVFEDNFETRSAILGVNGVRSYKSEIARLLLQATPAPPWTQQEMEDQLVTWADCQVQAVTDDFYDGFDPQQITMTGVRFYFEPTGSNITDFALPENVRQEYRSLTKTILTDIVNANKTRYNCSGQDQIDMSCPPTWITQNPNSGCY